MSAVPAETELLVEDSVSTNLPPLKAGFKIAYGLGQSVESVATVILNTFLFFYLTTVCGLSGSLTGMALFLALAIDAFADPTVGSLSDNLLTRYGRRIPPMAISLIPIALFLGLLFSIPRFTSGWMLFGYVIALLTGLRVSMSGFIIPYLGMGAELSDDYDERSSIVGFRAIFGMLATLAGFILGFQLFLGGPKGLLDRAAYAPFGWTSGVLMLLCGAVSTFASLHELPRMRVTVKSDKGVLRRFLSEVREVFGNPSFRMLFAGILIFFVGQGVFATLGLHASKYFWGLPTSAIQLIAISLVLGLALGLPLAFVLIGRVEKKTMVLAGIVLLCLAETLPILAKIAGIIPASVQAREDVLIVASVLGGVVTTLVAIAFQSAMADAVDEHEILFATRREGLYFASLSFASKAATGLGALVSGFILDLIAFPSAQIAAGKSVSIAPHVLNALGLATGPAAALLTVTSVFVFVRYRLDRAAHAEIRRALGR